LWEHEFATIARGGDVGEIKVKRAGDTVVETEENAGVK
jgi:hypothetical protein